MSLRVSKASVAISILTDVSCVIALRALAMFRLAYYRPFRQYFFAHNVGCKFFVKVCFYVAVPIYKAPNL